MQNGLLRRSVGVLSGRSQLGTTTNSDAKSHHPDVRNGPPAEIQNRTDARQLNASAAAFHSH